MFERSQQRFEIHRDVRMGCYDEKPLEYNIDRFG